MTERIGFIGLGTMGGPMAIRLARAGHDVVAFDIDPAAVERAVAGGCRPGADARDCALGCDLLFTSLPRPDHVRAVMIDGGVLAALAPRSIWVDLTTNRKELVLELAAQAPEGVTVIDCPVTGAVDGARTGKLTLFAGGSDPDLDRVVPVLENLGRAIRCGALGTGNVTKLVTNQLWFIHAAAIGEGFALGIANGVEIGVIWDAMKGSVADSFVARHDAPSIFAGHYDPSFTLGLCMKDLGLTMELAENVGTDLPMTTAAERTFARATERYGPAAGELHVAKRIEDDADLSFHLDGEWVPHWEV
jgi:3-hydroxyisobutyrate dehydrogenase